MQQELGMHETAEELRTMRGTSEDTLLRIRQRFALPDSMSDTEIFAQAAATYAVTRERSAADYARFLATPDTLPHYVVRCGDHDVLRMGGYHALRET